MTLVRGADIWWKQISGYEFDDLYSIAAGCRGQFFWTWAGAYSEAAEIQCVAGGKFFEVMLPESLVLPFSYVLPVAEFVIGLLLLAGLFTRAASVAGAIVMIILIFGSCMIEDWSAIPSQMIHVIFLLGVLAFVSAHDAYSIDRVIAK
jgi:thiosulfate dehydrogenase [quinone] large subunit